MGIQEANVAPGAPPPAVRRSRTFPLNLEVRRVSSEPRGMGAHARGVDAGVPRHPR